MLSTFIIEHFAIVRTVLALAAVSFLVLAAVLSRHGQRGRRVAGVVTVVATVVVLLFTLLPDKHPNPAIGCRFVAENFVFDMLNIALFLLPAIFAVVATRRPVLVLLGGVLLSAAIETVQAFSPLLGRRCDMDDWLANSTGTALGVLLALAAVGIAGRIRRRDDTRDQ